MIGIENALVFIIISIILIRLFFYIGNLYGYLMIMLFVVIPVSYIIKIYFLENNNLDYMVYYQQDYVNNSY